MSSGCSAIKAVENYTRRRAAAPHHAVTVFIFSSVQARGGGDTHFLIGCMLLCVFWDEIAMISSILINSKVCASVKNINMTGGMVATCLLLFVLINY